MKSQGEINQAFKTLLTPELEGYDPKVYPNVWAVYLAEYGNEYNLRVNKSHVQNVKQWLLGIPSCFSMPYTYHDIGLWLQENTGYEGYCFDSDIQYSRYWNKAAMVFVKTNQPKV